MTTYICKCGRRVQKSSNADNTGNRLKGYGPGHECYGCPYVLSWGTYEWNEETKHFVQDVKGYECRMSKTLSYASQFIGSTKDKCTCSVVSLDFDFLEQISAWVKETFTLGELTGHFSRDKIRATDYSHDGRYNYGLCCAGNKKGIAAKAALFAQFFNQDGSRKDMTPQQEMEKVLTDIRKAKEATECATAPNADAAATTAEIAVPNATEETLTTSASVANASASAPAASPQICASALCASVEDSSASPLSTASQDKPLAFIREDKCPEFDYSGLPDQTVENLHFAEDEYRHGKQMAERGLVHMGNAIAAAHDELCGVVTQCDNGEGACRIMRKARNNQHSEDTFKSWCLSIGITKDSAYRLLQVSALMDGSSPRQRAVLESLPPTLLYAVARPSAPPELVEKVKNGEVPTNKAYQDLLKENQQLRTDRVNAMNQAEREKQRAEKAEAERDKARADQLSTAKDCNRLGLKVSQEKDRADRAEARAKTAEDALKHQPIVGVTDPEEVDRLAHQQAYGIAADMTDEIKKEKDALQKQLKDRDRQLNVMRRQVNDLAQTDFEIANNFQVQIWSAWNSCKSSYSRLVGEDLESTFLAICQAMDGVKEEAARLCRQPVGYDGGADDEPDV